jgi:hypothetical protein
MLYIATKSKCEGTRKVVPLNIIKTYEGVAVYSNSFLTLILCGGSRLHAPATLPPGKQTLVTTEQEIG